MVLQLNLTNLTSNKPLLNLLKKLNYIEIREIKEVQNEQVLDAKTGHEELKAAFLMQSKRFLGNHYEKL
jgi:mRNA degradation ribonuclease J1/J2